VRDFTHVEAGTPADAWREHPSWSDLRSSASTLDPVAMGLDRVVVVAAHPDDESLGAGGLLATTHDQGLDVQVVLLTAGEASHPRSPTHTPDRLRDLRRLEATEAVALLAPRAGSTHLDLPDGGVAHHEETVVRTLVRLVGDGRRTLLVAPWRRDGHPDHEAAGRAAAVAAARTGATCWEYPIWLWHWGRPGDAPWSGLHAVALVADVSARKQAAIRSHTSQVQPLSDRVGDEVLLGPGLLAHFADDVEVFWTAPTDEPLPDRALDALHREQEEPWGADVRWYERRKRSLLLAALPRQRFARGLEVGCSTGVLTADLAGRCESVVAVDASPTALAAARTRLEPLLHVSVEQHDVPTSWPEGRFDLVVLSEVGYFLSPVALDDLVERVRTCLADDGVVVLCHWRHEVVGWPLDGPDVHARFVAAGVRPVVARYADRDVEILVLAADDQLPAPAS